MLVRLGLGKTYTCVTALAHIMIKYSETHSILLVPQKAVKSFKKELSTKLKVPFNELTSSKESIVNGARYTIITQTCLKKYTSYITDMYNKGYKLLLLVDEAHNGLEDNNSKFYSLFATLRPLFKVCWFATATPLKNNIEGLYWLFNVLDPKIFGDYEVFKQSFLVIERKRTYRTFGKGKNKQKKAVMTEEIVGYKNLEFLKSIIDKYNGIAMGNKDSKKVYLTFDNGYEAGYTEKILEVLKQNDVKATFFITAHYVNSQPELVQKMIDEGHIVGNHTVNHKSMPDISNEQIKSEVMNLHSAIYDKFGYEMKYIRPPKGECSERTIDYTNSLGYKTVMWSLAYDDWDENKQGREEYGKKKVLDNIHSGAVILLHSTSKDNSNILESLITEIQNMGYEFKSLDEYEV